MTGAELAAWISIGTTLLGFAALAIVWVVTNRKDIGMLVKRMDVAEISQDKRFKSLEEKVGMIATVMTKVAEQTVRLDAHSARLERLERQVDGKG